VRRVLDFLRFSDLPALTRRNYSIELRQISLWGIAAGTVEGYMAGVVASKTFGASELLTTVIWALPILINMLNVVWGTILRGRRRKPAFILLAGCGLVGVASVGLNPADWKPWSGWIFAAQIAYTHLFLSGLITLRTTIWKVNYPSTHRARVIGRLQTARLLLSVLTTLTLSLLYDHHPGCYRLVYPAAALVGVCSLVPLRRWRMRGERGELRQFREHLARNGSLDGAASNRVWSGLKEAVAILRTDTLFAKYMTAQFLLGAANFFTEPILINVLTKDLRLQYFASLLLLYVIAQTVLIASIGFWAPLFDRIGVLRFRIYNSACWVLSYVAVTVALLVITFGGRERLILAITILVVARILNGLGRGGGAIAWNLGHLHFARKHQTELYMGIHVGLTGLRGLVMPLVGLAATQVFGYGAMVCAVGLALAGHILFRRLAHQHGSAQ